MDDRPRRPLVGAAADQPGRHPSVRPDVVFGRPAWRPEGRRLGWAYAVLARLRAYLLGANYDIVARNRYGRLVRLIVNSGNGQIRRILQ